MDECKVCGRKNPLEGANFCYYCGASLRDGNDGISPAGDADSRREFAENGSSRFLSHVGRWLNAPDDDDDIEDGEEQKRVYRSDNPGETGADNKTPAVSRWKILGLLMLMLIPVYGWLFLIGWAIVNVVNSRTPADRKEIAHGVLMFFAAAIVLLFLVSAYLNAHPEVMEEYNRLYNQMMNNQAGILSGLRIGR